MDKTKTWIQASRTLQTAMLTSSERDAMNINNCDELNLCCGGGQLGVHLETLCVPLKDAAA